MPIEAILNAATEVSREIAKNLAKENSIIVKMLDKPLNVSEVKETAVKGTDLGSQLKDLDKPLNSAEHTGLLDSMMKDIALSEMDNGIEVDQKLGVDENGFRMLNESEKAELRDNTKWSDKAIDGCMVNEEGVIKYPCRNEHLAGQTNELTGVKYEKQIVEVYGYKVEVVMPKFDSPFETKLPDDLIEASDKEQFKECNKQLYDAIKENPDLAELFTDEQLAQIEEGISKGGAPDGYIWHHDAEVGSMRLVDADLHGDSRHTGGKTIWGGGRDFR